ncbi:hypothetical protein [Aquiflexum gelatinilyticum]|uniref:hypothetical protein n=1 Tax=Aquiflexum gelatinilyticum TaxID=2961943 RepID=UPI002166E076|nr:hypothetical protein [Aquiflexum gelatinilyticum]MCS4435213.1 hypothetical protein [Aquiflexum gelatinilyticum]
MMNVEITVALITAGAGLALGIFNSIKYVSTKRKLLILEEQGKKSEQIRLKATESGEVLIRYLSDIIISLETLKYHKKNNTGQEIEPLKNLNIALSSTYRKNYESALYTTPYIKEKVFSTVIPLLNNKFELTDDNIETWIEKIKILHTEVAELYRSTYLGSLSLGVI